MKQWIIENIGLFITSIFGGTSFTAYWLERNKRKLEETLLITSALTSTQTIYDKLTFDMNAKYDNMMDEITILKHKIKEVNTLLKTEEDKYYTLKVSYEKLKIDYNKLKKDFENYKLKN